jgi:hypothetical protein
MSGLILAMVLMPVVTEVCARERLFELECRLAPFPPQSVALEHGQWSMTHCEWLEKAEPTVPRYRRESLIKQWEYEKDAASCWKLLWFARQGIVKAKGMPAGTRPNPHRGMGTGSVRVEPPDCLEEVLKRIESRLDDLEKLLGKENFRAGRMPPPVAYWCFSRID